MSTDVFDGKVVFITGAASGIGRALAAALAKRSATLLLADIDADLLERTAWALGGEANDVHVFPLDVRKSSQWEHVVAEVYGRFDLCIGTTAGDRLIAQEHQAPSVQRWDGQQVEHGEPRAEHGQEGGQHWFQHPLQTSP